MFNFFKKKKKELDIYSIAKGDVIDLAQVPDEVFSQKMMGDGFAIKPENGDVFSPITGEVVNVFPTKHAIGLKADNGVEILLHLGVDTVELNGKCFESFVQVGDKVTPETKLTHIDLAQLKEEDKNDSLMVIFTNKEAIESLNVTYEKADAGDVVAKVTLK